MLFMQGMHFHFSGILMAFYGFDFQATGIRLQACVIGGIDHSL